MSLVGNKSYLSADTFDSLIFRETDRAECLFFFLFLLSQDYRICLLDLTEVGRLVWRA